MRSAIVPGRDYGGVVVVSIYGSVNKSIMWNVECLSCSKSYLLATSDVRKNKHGCSECYNSKRATGSLSPSWRGARFVSKRFLSNVQRNAKRRDIPCEIDLEFLDNLWIEQDHGRCAYTDVQLVIGKTASLDRIDSSLGYTTDNVQFVHKTVNIMKWNLTEEEFLSQLSLIWRKMTNA